MKRWLVLPALLLAAIAFAATGLADPGGGKGKAKGKTLTAKGGKIQFNDVVTEDHGCSFRVWAMDTIDRKYKVKKNQDGSYTVRREDKGTFKTTGPLSPSADPCPDVIRRGKHGTALTAGITGKMHGYITGKATGGTFNPNGSCASPCGNVAFIAGFFSPGTTYTCNQGYAGCRFNFAYTAQNQNKQKLTHHHWVDRGLNGVNETFIGDIATS
jgi:hypothetical protein